MAVVKQNTYNPGVNNDVTNVCVNVDLNRIGTDLSHVVWNGSQFVLKAGSLVENSGSLYSVTVDINLGNTTGNLLFNSSTSTFSIATTVATYDPAKGGYYTASTTRQLKWRMIEGGYYGIRQNLIGVSTPPTFETGLAIGDQNSSTTDKSMAIGYSNFATGSAAVAIGRSCISNANGSAAVGYSSVATGEFSCSIGNGSGATGDDSSALGRGNSASGDDSTSVGRNNNSSAEKSSAIGYINTSSGIESSAIGKGNLSSGLQSSAVGYANQSSGINSSAIGAGNVASSTAATALGSGNTASGQQSTAVGRTNTASGTFSASFGSNVTISSDYSTVIGYLGTNIKIFSKIATQSQVFTDLDRIGTGNGTTAPAIFYENFTFDSSKTGTRQKSAIVYKLNSTTWQLRDADSFGLVRLTFSSSSSSQIGSNFILLDIAR